MATRLVIFWSFICIPPFLPFDCVHSYLPATAIVVRMTKQRGPFNGGRRKLQPESDTTAVSAMRRNVYSPRSDGVEGGGTYPWALCVFGGDMSLVFSLVVLLGGVNMMGRRVCLSILCYVHWVVCSAMDPWILLYAHSREISQPSFFHNSTFNLNHSAVRPPPPHNHCDPHHQKQQYNIIRYQEPR